MASSSCRSCGTDLPPDARFCHDCGESQATPVCASCGTELIADARFCTSCGAPCHGDPAPIDGPVDEPVPASPVPLTSRRVTSVLFADLVGFTTLAEGRDHEEVRELQTQYYDRTRTIVARYGGTLEKFIGDAVMAVWGVSTAHEDDAERAVRAGLEIIDAVALVQDEAGMVALDVRVGVVTGEVTVTVGATGQGLVAGDAVNTAARVQSVATPGQVWVDETTRLLTHAAIRYTNTGSHSLKGKQEPTALWAAKTVVANVGGGQRADGLEAPLTGRHRELRLIKELFHRTEETRQPEMLLVSSDPGLGKTRLGWEFSKYADGLNSSVRWLEGRCVAYGDSIAFYALAEAIRGRMWSLRPDHDADHHADDLAALVELGLATYVDDPADRDWIRPRLEVLLLGSERAFDQHDLFAAWISFLSQLARGAAAVVLLIDDAEHADDGFVAFLEQALQTDGLPLFVLLLARHELLDSHAELMSNRRTTVLRLSPLTKSEMSALVTGLVHDLPDEVREGLVRRAEGVPLFAMETVRSMIDRDLIIPRAGQYVLADPDMDLETIGSPASLHALIASRLDALAPPERRVVDSASVLGQGFTRDILTVLHPEGADGLDAALASLVRRQILTFETSPLSGDFGRYGFVQDVVRQVAYRILARRDRRAAHLRVVDHFGEGPGELASLVAQHLIAAAEAVPSAPDVEELRERACRLLVATAHRTLGRGIATGAVDQLTEAIALSPEGVGRARVETLLARALGTERAFAAQEDVAARALKTLDAHGDREDAAMAAAHLAFAYNQTGRTEESITVLRERWDEMAARDGADAALCLVGRYLLLSLHHTGRFDQIIQVALPTMGAAERTGDDLALLRIIEIMAHTTRHLRLPRLTDALVTLQETVTNERGLDTTDISARCVRAMHAIWHDLDAARLAIDELDAHIETHRIVSVRGWMTLERLLIDLAAGSWNGVDDAYDGFADLLESLELGTYTYIGLRLASARGISPRPEWAEIAALHRPDDRPPGDLLLAAVHALESGTADASTRAAALAAQAARRGRSIHASEGVLLFADCLDVAASTGSADAVRALLDMLPSGENDQTLDIAVKAHRARARALLSMLDGTPGGETEAHLREAVDHYETWGAGLWARRCEAELGRHLIDQGRDAEGVVLLTRVEEFYEQIGATAWLAHLKTPSGAPAQRSPA